MPTEKLHQNRAVVLGFDYNDAAFQGRRHPEVAHEDVTFVSANASSLTILGGVGGMHVGTLYVTPAARRGQNYEIAREALETCLRRADGRVIELSERGALGAL